jgi:hypothetical protein
MYLYHTHCGYFVGTLHSLQETHSFSHACHRAATLGIPASAPCLSGKIDEWRGKPIAAHDGFAYFLSLIAL